MNEIMPVNESPSARSNYHIAIIAASVFILDQFTKWLVLHSIFEGDEKIIIPGFFNLAHRANTGAASRIILPMSSPK